MCRVNFVINRLMLGNRELGWECFNGKGIEEYTSKQLLEMIRNGKDKVYGLCIGKDGELELDKEGFYVTSIMEHRHVGNYRPMDSDSSVNMSYICMGVDILDGNEVYNCISNKFESVLLSKEQIKAYMMLGVITAGVRIRNGEIEVAVIESAEKKEEVKAPVVVTEAPQKDEAKKEDPQLVEVKKEEPKLMEVKKDEKKMVKDNPKVGITSDSKVDSKKKGDK